MHRGPRQHQTVEQRDRHADLGTVRRAEHRVANCTVQIQRVADPPVRHREHPRRAVDDEADVRHERLVEDVVGQHAIEASAFGVSADPCAFGGEEQTGHRIIVPAGPARPLPDFTTLQPAGVGSR